MRKKIFGVTVGTALSPDKIKEKIKPVTSVNGVKADENGNVEVDIPEGGGVTSWNDLTDRPFYVDRTIETISCDSVEGLESKNLLDTTLYKIDERVPVIESLYSAKVEVYAPELDKTGQGNLIYYTEEMIEIFQSMGMSFPEGVYAFIYAMMHSTEHYENEDFASGMLLFSCKENSWLPIGIWYMANGAGYPHTLKIHDVTIETIVQLDEKFIPNTIAKTADIPSTDGLATEEFVLKKIANIDIPGGGSGGSGSGAGIIDVFELPTENINTKAFYRLTYGYLVFNGYDQRESGHYCICVDSLPTVGQPVTTDMNHILAYYNAEDGDVYGYITDKLGAVAGVPAGWYTLAMLAPVFGVSWNGVITDIDDDPQDDSFRLLLAYDYYTYRDGWNKMIYASEKFSEFDIKWDGVIGDRFALDMSVLGFEGVSFVKVSDDVFTAEQLVGAIFGQSNGYSYDIDEDSISTDTYPGALTIDGGSIVIVYAADDLNSALGLPSGYITNGTYFVHNTSYDDGTVKYTNHFVGPTKVTKKIDGKYLDLSGVTEMINQALGVIENGSY